jgi:hypothetical protein
MPGLRTRLRSLVLILESIWAAASDAARLAAFGSICWSTLVVWYTKARRSQQQWQFCDKLTATLIPSQHAQVPMHLMDSLQRQYCPRDLPALVGPAHQRLGMGSILFLALTWVAPAVAAPPKLPPVSISIRTAGDLALACSAKPINPGNAALLNFCNGFAQGVVQTERLNPGGSKICLPTPAPKRSETMKTFVKWVMADADRKKEGASAGFIRFMSEQYPCK